MSRKENQNTEFKQSWRDEHLKSICAFANTHGGTLFVGKDDIGNVMGISNIKKLLDDIPNQIKNSLGIVAEVNSKKIEGKEIIIVKIKPAKSPVSHKGKFYKRSGSTTQELNGSELQSFLLEKNNIAWESVIEESASLSDIDEKTIEQFKNLAKKRFAAASEESSITRLLEKLHLIKGKKLTRAAILLFGKDPQKFYPSAYVRIGRFKDDVTFLSMDDIKGNLFQQASGTMEILIKKYLYSDIKIEGLYREDHLEIPEPSLREAIVNAIVHKDYSDGTTQIKLYPDYVSIWNNGELTSKLTIEKLKKRHPSFPRNELIAETFFKAGLIEKWGYGTVKIIDECVKAGLPDPVFEQDAGGMQVTFLKSILNEDYLKRLQLNDRQIKAVLYVKEFGKITNSEYQQLTSASKRTVTSDFQILTEKDILLKVGATGKGTQYILQRGSKGAKGANKGHKVADSSNDELDKKIGSLENELARINPNDEVRWHFNRDVFFKMFDLWLDEFLINLIPVTQKFNKLFTSPRHHIFIINGIGQVEFINDKPELVIRKLKEDCSKYTQQIYDATVNVNLNYGTFRKGGLKTFGCNYGVEIKFERIKYTISIDEFSGEVMKNRVFQFERLLHKPVTKSEITAICKSFGETIYNHIDFLTKKEGLR